MTDRATSSTGDTPRGHDRSTLDRLLLEQRQRWRLGDRWLVEAILGQHQNLHAADDAVLDLIYNEVILRQENGESLVAEEYRRRFPHLAADIQQLFEVDQGLQVGDASQPPAETMSGPGGDDHPNRTRPVTSFDLPGYDSVQFLGRGGMGVVYKARQIALDRIVALKVIRAGVHADAEDLRRFRTEALAAARLQHPNIAQVYEVAEHEGRPYLVLEYVAGGGLDNFLDGTPLAPTDAAELAETLARAVHFAHERGVIHRDLKPANILLADALWKRNDATVNSTVLANRAGQRGAAPSQPKITDFGLAKLMDAGDARTQTGHVVGTPTYMAPEQADGRQCDIGPATDVYALGAVLYECLTGHPPFQGQSPIDTLALVKHQEPVPPRRMRPKVPRDLETICLKCLEKDAHRRYATAQALGEDIARFRAGKPVRARPIRVWGRGLRWLRRHPAWAAAIALSFALVAAGLVAGWIALDRQSQTNRGVEMALREATTLRNDRKWSEALAALRRAEELLGHGFFGSSQLRQRIAEQHADLDFANAIEQIQLRKGEVSRTRHELHPRRDAEDYKEVFAKHGITLGVDDPDELGRRLRHRPPTVCDQIVNALDDWIVVAQGEIDANQADWINRVIAAADPDDEWRKRMRLARQNRDLDALKQLAAGAEAMRQPAHAVLLLGAILTSHGAITDGVELLRRAQRQMPGDFWINTRLSGYCVGLNPPQFEEALQYARVAQALRPKDSSAQFYVGYILQKLERTDDAIAAFRRAAELDPDYVVGLLYLASSLGKDSNWAKAEFALRQAIEVRPDSASAHNDLAAVLQKTPSRLAEAIAIQREAVRLNPNSAPYRNSLGTMFVANGQRDQAIECFSQAVAVDTTCSPAYANLGYLLMLDGKIDESVVALRRSVDLHPDEPVAHLNLGRALRRQGRVDDAIASFRAAIRQHPTMAEAHVSLGSALEAQNDQSGALAAYRLAVASDGNNPNGHCNLGLLLLKIGNPAEALKHLKIGHELGSKVPKWNRPSAQWVQDAEQQLGQLKSTPPGP